MAKFTNKTILITGCNRGIGREAMMDFMKEEANIIACTRVVTEKLKAEYVDFNSKFKSKIYPIAMDLSNEDNVKSAIKEIKELKLVIDILVNNAGVPHLAILPFTKMIDAHHVFQINYFSQLLIIQGVYPLMKKSTSPSIINVASIAGIDGEVGNAVYGASKAAMILLTKVLSKEFASLNIRVNAVAPGLTLTDFADKMGNKAKDSMINSSVKHRLAKPEEIVNSILFLASEDASFINGQILRIDGGIK